MLSAEPGLKSSVLGCDPVGCSTCDEDEDLIHGADRGELNTGLGQAGVANKGVLTLAGVITHCHATVFIIQYLYAHQEARDKKKLRIWSLKDDTGTKQLSDLWQVTKSSKIVSHLEYRESKTCVPGLL